MKQHPDNLKSQLRLAYRLALSREPEDDELFAAEAFVVDQSNQRKSMTDFCQTIFALNEFLYVD
jgi:ribosomal protein L4